MGGGQRRAGAELEAYMRGRGSKHGVQDAPAAPQWGRLRDLLSPAIGTACCAGRADGRTEVGLVFKCGSFNVIDINRPIGELAALPAGHAPGQAP